MCFVPSDLRISLNFVHICEQLYAAKFQAISATTDVSIYCEERKTKLLIDIDKKIYIDKFR